MGVPRLISVDDHLVEPPDLWVSRLPEQYAAAAPRVERMRVEAHGHVGTGGIGVNVVESAAAPWADVWRFGDVSRPLMSRTTGVTSAVERMGRTFVTYDEIRPGCWQQAARLSDMDLDGIEAQLCFPQFPRFCGETFLACPDTKLARLCVRAYNEFVIDEWCAGVGAGRLIPQVILPLWDPELAAAEVRWAAERDVHAVSFSENPSRLGLPSMYSDHWDALFATCQEVDSVISLHVGSASTVFSTTSDAPFAAIPAMNFVYPAGAVVDWLLSGVLARFPELRVVLAEGQGGWLPYVLERLDRLWTRGYEMPLRQYSNEPPTSLVSGRFFCTIFDDVSCLIARSQIGMSQIMLGTYYPHRDSTFPESVANAERMVAAAALSECEATQLARANAITCFRLDRYGIELESGV